MRERAGGKPVRTFSQQFLESRHIGFTYDLGNDFYNWAKEQSDDVLKQDIIAVKNLFNQRVIEADVKFKP